MCSKSAYQSATMKCTLLLSLIAPVFAFATVAWGQDGATANSNAAVVVSFEGGIVGTNVWKVLNILQKNAIDIPLQPYVVQTGDTLCGLLDVRHYPQPCGDLAGFINTLNPQSRPAGRALSVGETINLPNIEMQPYTAVDNYSNTIKPQQQEAITKLKNYAGVGLSPFPVAPFPDRTILQYKAYRMTIPAATDAAAVDIAVKLQGLGTRNIYVDVIRANNTEPQKLNTASSPSQINFDQSECISGQLEGMTFRYSDIFDSDTDALGVVANSVPPQLTKVVVNLVDVPLIPTPNLTEANGAARWTCHWVPQFKQGLNHATHLAGIIASQKGPYGFLGLAPNAQIKSFVWDLPDGDGDDVKSAGDRQRLGLANLMTSIIGSPQPIFLAAADFDLPPGADPDKDLFSPTLRYCCKIPGTIRAARPLLIVAAGQASKNHSARQITATSPTAPQYYGDLENVVVVTACDACKKDSATLMPGVNFSKVFVHVAAPGGIDVPGWMSMDGIGVGHGTSQAAAFVAGVAAEMIGSYPTTYTGAAAVKTRLQVTSRPFPVGPGGAPSADQDKLAAGVVDPTLALLDPRKSWLKDSTGWHDIKLRGWNGPPPTFVDLQGQHYQFDDPTIARILKMTTIGGIDFWAIYQDMFKAAPNVAPATVVLVNPVQIETDAKLALCDGTNVDLASIQDLIPSLSGISPNACSDP